MNNNNFQLHRNFASVCLQLGSLGKQINPKLHFTNQATHQSFGCSTVI